MKKFYCNGKIVYLHNIHTEQSAKNLLALLVIAGRDDNVCQALDKDQDLLDCCEIGPEEAAFMHTCDEESYDENLDRFLTDTPTDEDCDHYILPSGKSAPYGLTGVEVAEMSPKETVFLVSTLYAVGVVDLPLYDVPTKMQLVAVDRDLIFSSREKAVEAYNALFGDLYGTI